MEEVICMFESTDPFFQRIEVTDAKINHTIHALEAMYEMASISLNLSYSEADLKVMKESGTYDDLSYFYEEAEKEFEEKAGVILDSMFKAISTIFTDISNSITNYFDGNYSEDDEIKIDVSIEKKVSALDKVSVMITSLLSAIKNNKGKDVITGIIGTGGIASIEDTFKDKLDNKVIEVPRTVINAWLEKIKEISDSASIEIENIGESEAGEKEKCMVKSVLQVIATSLRKLSTLIVLSTFLDSESEDEDETNKENSTNKQSDNQLTESEEIQDTQVQGNIFGYSLEAEYLLQEAEKFEDQMNQLSNIL